MLNICIYIFSRWRVHGGWWPYVRRYVTAICRHFFWLILSNIRSSFDMIMLWNLLWKYTLKQWILVIQMTNIFFHHLLKLQHLFGYFVFNIFFLIFLVCVTKKLIVNLTFDNLTKASSILDKFLRNYKNRANFTILMK